MAHFDRPVRTQQRAIHHPETARALPAGAGRAAGAADAGLGGSAVLFERWGDRGDKRRLAQVVEVEVIRADRGLSLSVRVFK